MKGMKKHIDLNGSLVRPLSVGMRAVIRTGGKLYLTGSVVVIHEQTAEQTDFETADIHYHVSLSPEPVAEICYFPVEMAVCV